mmetsp:Transcript_82991/g.130531  ORF Transcript_82991/g.130531 Transcript_82991/m.130531 type:complete len:249 (-) Transcript_82991:34-780(-)
MNDGLNCISLRWFGALITRLCGKSQVENADALQRAGLPEKIVDTSADDHTGRKRGQDEAGDEERRESVLQNSSAEDTGKSRASGEVHNMYLSHGSVDSVSDPEGELNLVAEIYERQHEEPTTMRLEGVGLHETVETLKFRIGILMADPQTKGLKNLQSKAEGFCVKVGRRPLRNEETMYSIGLQHNDVISVTLNQVAPPAPVAATEIALPLTKTSAPMLPLEKPSMPMLPIGRSGCNPSTTLPIMSRQ